MSLRWAFGGDNEALGVTPSIVVSRSLVKQSETLVLGE
jgi:hypothetical protein